jgi:hypothetical protein
LLGFLVSPEMFLQTVRRNIPQFHKMELFIAIDCAKPKSYLDPTGKPSDCLECEVLGN